MFDRQTESLWSQFLGEVIEGPLQGSKMDLVASQLTTWGSWTQEHPGTVARDIGKPAIDQSNNY